MAPVFAPVSASAAAASVSFRRPCRRRRSKRAQQYQQRLPAVQRTVARTQNGAVWRIQLGPFASKAEAPARYSNVCKQKHNYSPYRQRSKPIAGICTRQFRK